MSKAGTNHRSVLKDRADVATHGGTNTASKLVAKAVPKNHAKPVRTPKRRTPTPRTAAAGRSRKNGSALAIDETIKSDFVASRLLQERILGAVSEHNFTPHSAFAIKLALEEAMINAIKHGNKLDASKHVHVKATVSPTLAEFVIEDEGPGFERHAVPDPTLIENLEKCSGRGIMLIEAYMNCVEWSNRGRCLRMIKRNGEEAGTACS